MSNNLPVISGIGDAFQGEAVNAILPGSCHPEEILVKEAKLAGSFVILEGVKRKKTVSARVNVEPQFRMDSSWCHYYPNYYSNSATSVEYADETMHRIIIPTDNFKGSRSFLKDEQLPVWMIKSKEQALNEANEAQEKKNHDVLIANFVNRKKAEKEYVDKMWAVEWERMSDFEKWFVRKMCNKEQWIDIRKKKQPNRFMLENFQAELDEYAKQNNIHFKEPKNENSNT